MTSSYRQDQFFIDLAVFASTARNTSSTYSNFLLYDLLLLSRTVPHLYLRSYDIVSDWLSIISSAVSFLKFLVKSFCNSSCNYCVHFQHAHLNFTHAISIYTINLRSVWKTPITVNFIIIHVMVWKYHNNINVE